MPNQESDRFRSRSNGNEPRVVHRKIGDNPVETGAQRPRLFSGISPADYAGICRAAHVKQFARGEILYFEGEPVKHFFLLTSGSVKVAKLSRGGEAVIIRLTSAGDVLGAISLFSSGQYCSTVEVLRACRALVWDSRVFEDLMERFPVLHQNMVAILNERLQELENRFREVATDKAGPRVALQLLRLLNTFGQPVKAGVEIALSREELAQMTGTTLFTVSRLLSAWEQCGVVRPRREAVAICDVQSLRAISEEG
jgi:CRP-like cAMP-binding protein